MKDIPNTRAVVILFAALMAVTGGAVRAEVSTSLRDCGAIQDSTERLRCYDTAPVEPAGSPEKPALEQRTQKERDLARRAFAILPHRPNYVLNTYNGAPNIAPFAAADPEADYQHQEIKFQISLRVPLWNKMLFDNGDLWFGYSQMSFWQAYNSKRSRPFRETNYEPELGLTFHTDFSLLGLKARQIAVGFAHQSNGRDDSLSRSWNRVWASFTMERGNFILVLKPWYRIQEEPGNDDNPDMENYAGRAQMLLVYKYRDQVFSSMLRNNLQTGNNRSGYELGWTVPYSKNIKGLVQYYNGYAESLIDYNVRTRRIGIGILVEDWL